MILVTLLVLGACGESSETDTETETETETEEVTDSATDTETEEEEETETETETEEEEEETETETETEVEQEETDTETETETETDTSVDTSTETDEEPEPEPEEELGPEPTDYELTIVDAEGNSEYIIVYERRNAKLATKAKSLADHIKSTYGVTLTCYEYGTAPSTANKRIVLGNAHENAKFAKAKIAKANDFVIDVVEDDLILYAANEYLYDYLCDIAKAEIFNGAEKKPFVIPADKTYKLSESDKKDINYAQYLKAKNGDFKYETVLELFGAVDSTGAASLPYRIYVPSSYDSTKDYPVVLVLHGAGERGNDNKSQLKNMISEMFNQESSPYLESIIICPQCPANEQWVDTPWADGNYSIDDVAESSELIAVMDILNDVKEAFSTNENRYYVMGLSMGGFGTWDLIMRHTDVFAAAVCLCGGGDPSQAGNLVNMPIWAIHGTSDTSVPYAGTQEMCQAIIEAGGTNCKFDSPNCGHDVWKEAGKNTEISKWLFEQKKP